MDIGIIGASAAGIYAALHLSRTKEDINIHLFDRADKIGKKLLATGNGHCNLMHVPFVPDAFNHPEFVSKLLSRFDEEFLFQTLRFFGIHTFEDNGLVYPLSNSAASHVRFLSDCLKEEGISVHLSEEVVEVDGTTLITKKGRYAFDELIFAFGGKSQSKLGSDGSMFGILRKLGYKVTPLRPSLCPIQSPDVPKSLFGVRHEAMVYLKKQGKVLFQEWGEVQFKADALSGIVVMNASSKYEEGSELELDLFPNIEEKDLAQKIHRSRNEHGASFLNPFLCKELVEFVLKNEKIPAEGPLNLQKCTHIAHFLKSMTFRCGALYPFESSQVTRGGIALDEVDECLRSKKNPHHHFVGECLDIDGLCGGFNLGFALLSAIVVSASL